jgi:Fuc2NAc and GlcNAc transferase
MHLLNIGVRTIFIVMIGLISFRYLWILDKPWPDIIPKRLPVPTIQGIFLVIGRIIGISLFYGHFRRYPEFQALAGWWILIALISLIDQFWHISPKIRLIVQMIIGAAALYRWNTGITTITRENTEIILPVRIQYGLTIGRFIIFINAINRIDGINWLASWTSTIGYITIFILIDMIVLQHFQDTITEHMYFILSMTKTLAITLGFFSFLYSIVEFKPRWLVRDVWTMFYGFSLAYLALLWWAKIGTIVVVLSLPLFDAIWTFCHRIFFLKKNPLKGDYTHLHYRLLWMGRSRSEVKRTIRIFSIVMMILILLQQNSRINKIIIVVLVFVLFFVTQSYIFRIKKKKTWLDIVKKE